ncbi:MAG: hypothetical protein DRI39_00580 [Chloroflexi bacterium]|nr:MAG: hypothetical protein DRI39_00580 [Chloroflexota bacterium]
MKQRKSDQAVRRKSLRRSVKLSDYSSFSFDMLYQLSYMSVVAGAGAPRDHIFRRAAELPCSLADYFMRVERTRRRLGCDYAKACRMVAEAIDKEEIKALLLRLSSSLVSGEPESEFLKNEAEAQSMAYTNEYERSLESLKQWTDAYVSLVMAAVLVVIIGVVSTMIWKMSVVFILTMVGISIGIAAIGVWLIYLLSPREIVVPAQPGSREQKLVKRLVPVLLPLALVVCVLLALTGMGAGWIMMAVALVIFPIGYLSVKDDRRVTKKDMELGPFLRSLGGVASAIGTTVKDALGRLDLDSIRNLRPDLRRLNASLRSGLTPRVCWARFTNDTGSELAKRSVGMFYDVVEVGGEPEEAGQRAAFYASNLAMLRARRKTVSFPFRWLCIGMHAALTGLLIFVVQVVATFGSMVAEAQAPALDTASGLTMGYFTSFNLGGLELMQRLVLPLVIVFTVSNALAPSIADGGSRWKIVYHLGLTAFISGASLVCLPEVAEMIFSAVER